MSCAFPRRDSAQAAGAMFLPPDFWAPERRSLYRASLGGPTPVAALGASPLR
jgi:hypothetical protein